MAVVSLTYTVVDNKGEQSTITLYTTDNQDLTALINAAIQTAQLIANVLTGKLVEKASLCVNIDLGILSNNTAAVGSDVEEGALFFFETAAGVDKRNRLPTFDEAKIITGTRDVDGTDVDVLALQSQIAGGASVEDGTGATVSVTFGDSRGSDITIAGEAYESFQSSRNRRR